MFCPKCGEQNPEGAQFCHNCGMALTIQAVDMLRNKAMDSFDSVKYAGFWRRFAAYLIDSIVLAIVQWVLMIVLALMGSVPTTMNQDFMDVFSASLAFAIIVVYLFSGWLYFSIMESSELQATLGKMAVGIKVTDYNLNRISFGRATGRYFAKIISGLIFLIGYIIAGFTEKKQALHDFIANTYVVVK